MDLLKYYTPEKMNIIFTRLSTFIEKNFKSFICKDSILTIKLSLQEVFIDKGKIELFYREGIDFYHRRVLFVESVSFFDFLRKNFISHLPNNIDLREAKRVERLFDDIIEEFSRGYLESYIREVISRVDFFLQHIKIKDYNEILSRGLNNHFEFFRKFLKNLLGESEFQNIKHTECDFGKWLHNNGKLVIDDDSMYQQIKQFHKNFHDLIDICFDYKQHNLYKEIFFILKDMESTSLWLANKVVYVNAKIISMEFSKDFLTGLLNRRALNQILNKHLEISEFTGQPVSLIITDIDFFKKINDTYGHLAGDAALKHFASILKENLRKSDYIFRIGGEEFLILLPNTSLEEARKVSENLRQKVESSPLHYENKTIRITASFGVSELRNQKHIDEIMKDADEKLYKAKRDGRNRVVV
ncbi:MAG: sensor domain-containing diguanylate cyclase [Hydrogenothermaceae bacterium]|nr:sensor domain-containing diguanylate cyclase [Hydrogenothermaceae bacterium]